MIKGLAEMNETVAKDLIELVNGLKGLEKTSKVSYSVKNGQGGWTKKEFNYVPLDNILNRIKENKNFALLQPVGVDEGGINGVKCILIHKSGHVLETGTFPFYPVATNKIQDEGAEITYRKRYSVSAFLGIATDEDTDGNDNDAEPVNTPYVPISIQQINYIMSLYTPEELTQILGGRLIESLSKEEGSNLITRKAGR